jgi:hypothetical protein
LLIDRILEMEPGQRVVAEKDVRPEEPWFEGHFPGQPVMPGVLIVEAMAQAIGNGGTPFSNLREISLTGRRVFTVTDSNSAHYFFQSGAKVIWIAPPGDSGPPFVETALRKF